MKSNFDERRENRLAAYQGLAAKNQQASTDSYNTATNMLKVIPLGQPILVGHHSERSHRRLIEKSDNAMRRSIEHDAKADYYARRAQALESNRAIFSDDPNASEKLADKIARLEKQQELMREANKLLRKNDREGLLNLGFSEQIIDALYKPDFCGRTGFPSFRLTNNGANIRRLKERLAQIEKQNEAEPEEITINTVRILQNTEENRTQIFFPGKPSDDVRQALKSRGFRWSPSQGAWQRHLSNAAIYHAKEIATKFFTA